MKRVTREVHHEHIGFGDSEITLSGPPTSLRGPVILQNATDEPIFVRELPMKNIKNADAAFPIHTTLQPFEVRSQNIYYSMNPHTPPGTYEMNVQMGDETKKVKLIVHESLAIQLSPQAIVLEGIEAGMQHTKEILFSNKGNIALTVPTIKHNTLTDMDLICRNLSQAVRISGDEGIEKTLDTFAKGLKKDITDWVDISIKEAGQVVEPGQTISLHLTITLPKDVNKNYHYTGDIRMFDKIIRYTAIDKASAGTNSKPKKK
ncbi:MAG: hypothetical protein ABI472_11160 [Ginsengibacter sp.]